jgi:ATP/maltotriose-dependent transcriptional regulator MalT/DNA-binding SARP family transcriptional activator
VIQAKMRLPPPPEGVVARPRLDRALAEMIEGHRVVVVAATAGAGKTTAVSSAMRRVDVPAAWLTVDRTDTTPGRLLVYLEAALTQQLPRLRGLATRALAAGIAHEEAAGMLAEAASENRLILVVDDLERLGSVGAAWSVLDGFMRYASPALRILLLSRVQIPRWICQVPGAGEVAVLGEHELAFTAEEAGQALAARGRQDVDAVEVVAATGGWVTGVLFEAWRPQAHIDGAMGEGDPLYGYLSSHILSQLNAPEREFLIATSLLDEVSAGRARALGFDDPLKRLASLRAVHLPVSWLHYGHTMRCHPRFREYLQHLLDLQTDQEIHDVRLAHARLLDREGRAEEAANELLMIGEPGAALAPIERSIVDVVERLDTPVAERWLHAVSEVTAPGTSTLTTAELMIAVASEDYRRAVAVADRLAHAGARDAAARVSERDAAFMAWAYGAYGRFKDAIEVLAAAEDGPMVDAILYSFALFGAAGRRPRPSLSGGPLDAIIYWADYGFGRLRELTAEATSPWAEALARPWRMAALRASGLTQQALEMFEATRPDETGSVFPHAIAGPEILLDAGRTDEALQLVRSARAHAHRSTPLYALWNGVTEAKILLRGMRDTKAGLALLEALVSDSPSAQIPMYREMLDTWLGLALLRLGEDQRALSCLRKAVSGMVAGDRFLELPTACVYLAEAEWRAGRDDAADAAADLALRAAARHGSNHSLLQALADFPAVAARRIDAERDADSAWHALGRALDSQGIGIRCCMPLPVAVREFGRSEIVVDGLIAHPKIKKSVELLAYLLTRGEPAAERAELLVALFDGRDDRSTRAYLREAIRQLRQVLPAGVVSSAESGRVALSETVRGIAQSVRFENGLAEASRLRGEDRLRATLDVLAIFDAGEYLPDVTSEWAHDRRQHLGELSITARFEAACVAYEVERYAEARQLVDHVVRADPFREAPWRLSMRVRSALGDEDGVIRAFQRCRQALAEVGTRPSITSVRLLESLRR